MKKKMMKRMSWNWMTTSKNMSHMRAHNARPCAHTVTDTSYAQIRREDEDEERESEEEEEEEEEEGGRDLRRGAMRHTARLRPMGRRPTTLP